MKNLKYETLEILEQNEKTADDIKWIGCRVGNRFARDYPFMQIPIDAFWKVSDRQYNDGYGGKEVNTTLVIVGDNWWLERAEYDGKEWWEFKTLPIKPEEIAGINYLTAVFYNEYL